MLSRANVAVIVIRVILCAISFLGVGWFIIYLKRRMELKSILQKKFLLATLAFGFFGGLGNIPGAVMLLCISSETDTKNLVLSFFQTLLLSLTVYGHIIALYLRSCDIVDSKARKITKYLIIAVFMAMAANYINAFVSIFIPIDKDLAPFDPVRCTVKIPGILLAGLISGALIFIIDCIFMYHFVQYLRKTKQIFQHSPSDVMALISHEAVKILVFTFIGFLGFGLYEIIPGDVGTVSALLFHFSLLAGFLLWIRLKYMLDHRDSQVKYSPQTTKNINPVRSSLIDIVTENFSYGAQSSTRASHTSLKALEPSVGNSGDKSRLDSPMNQSLEDGDLRSKKEEIP